MVYSEKFILELKKVESLNKIKSDRVFQNDCDKDDEDIMNNLNLTNLSIFQEILSFIFVEKEKQIVKGNNNQKKLLKM